MLTRRRFLLTLPAFAAAPQLAQAQSFAGPFRKKPPAPLPPTFVYFGTDTAKGVAKGVYLSRFDAATGKLTVPLLVAETLRPAFLAITPMLQGHRCLYATNEGSDAASSAVSTFLIDAGTGGLRPLNQVSAAAAGPCYVSVDATGHSAFVADYAGSTVATYHVLSNGALSEPVERIGYKDPKFGARGPNANQDAPHPHSVHLSPDNRFLIVNDLGCDEISVFPVDVETAHLGQPALFSNDRRGSGPRHIAFHPNGRWVYSINELDSTIDLFLWTTTSSRTIPQGLLVKAGNGTSTLAPGFPVAKNAAAEVQLSPDGRFLYASNRGEDSLVVFAIAPTNGSLTFVQRISCGGKTPRNFTLSSGSDAHWLLCGNQNSATVAVFRRDPPTGKLSGPTQSLALDSPMFTLFA
jgi:6-phosphogluconolactonase